ncbi:hypothetical protein [Streptomyces albicerus]|uniref:hypothetical protein n=1 Tax=Streptomyces albicerus TaxID=2569859 RepID=UPI001788CCFB|nr:hypothetical protein [Streptomyces albicerus]
MPPQRSLAERLGVAPCNVTDLPTQQADAFRTGLETAIGRLRAIDAVNTGSPPPC